VIQALCGTASPPCPAEQCCDRSNDEGKYDLTGYQTFISDIQKMVHTGFVT